MRFVLVQCARVAAAAAAIYALLAAVAVLLVPFPKPGAALDTAAAPHTIFANDAKYVVLARVGVADEAPAVVLLGGSQVEYGFRQPELQALVPGAVVHNMAVGRANYTEVAEIADLMLERMSAAARRRAIFVIGAAAAMFPEDRIRWTLPTRNPGGVTDIEFEAQHFRLYRRAGRHLIAVLPPADLRYALFALYPLVLGEYVAHAARDAWSDAVPPPGEPRGFARRDGDLDAVVLTEPEKAAYLARRARIMGTAGPLATEQIDALSRLVERLLAAGSRVVMVDLPTPRWASRGSPYQANYQRQVRPVLDRLAGLGAVYVNMQDMDRDEDFYDDAHPKPRAARQWSARLAPILNGLLGEQVAEKD